MDNLLDTFRAHIINCLIYSNDRNPPGGLKIALIRGELENAFTALNLIPDNCDRRKIGYIGVFILILHRFCMFMISFLDLCIIMLD